MHTTHPRLRVRTLWVMWDLERTHNPSSNLRSKYCAVFRSVKKKFGAIKRSRECICLSRIASNRLWMHVSLKRSKSQRLHDRREVSSALLTPVHGVSSARRIVAAAVDNARTRVDVGLVRDVHTGVRPVPQLFHVHPAVLVDVALHGVEPVEKSCDPFERRRRRWVADDFRVFAEIEVRVEHGAVLFVAPSSHVVVQLAEVARAGGLDDTAAPPE